MKEICIILCAKNIIKFRICIILKLKNFQIYEDFLYFLPDIYERFIHIFDLYDIVSLD